MLGVTPRPMDVRGQGQPATGLMNVGAATAVLRVRRVGRSPTIFRLGCGAGSRLVVNQQQRSGEHGTAQEQGSTGPASSPDSGRQDSTLLV
jgi:hypothetical protein